MVRLDIYNFNEDGSEILFCPALNLYGYGNNLEEASSSLKFSVLRFFEYTTKNKSLARILNGFGWSVGGENQNDLMPPSVEKLLVDNEAFKELFSNKEFNKKFEQFEIPAFV